METPRNRISIWAYAIVFCVIAAFFFELGGAVDGDWAWGLAFFPLAAFFIAIVIGAGLGVFWTGRFALLLLRQIWPKAPEWMFGAAFVIGTIAPVLIAGRAALYLLR